MRRLTILLALLAPACATSPTDRGQIESAATQPLRDTRLRDDRIPEVLLLAESAPYSTRGLDSCPAIATEIHRLSEVLGADADAPGTDPSRGAAIAAAATRLAMNSLIPGLGLVRFATGADRQQARVEAAIYAGSIRRSFLTGLGAARGCRPPAAPSAAAREAVQALPARDEAGE